MPEAKSTRSPMETELTVSCKESGSEGFFWWFFFGFLRGVCGMPQRFLRILNWQFRCSRRMVLESAGDISTLAGIQILNLAFLHQG